MAPIGQSSFLKTASEELFETYLKNHGCNNFEYEPEIVGTAKRPDYRIQFAATNAFFEIKEFEPGELPMGAGSFDPYPTIREKINAAHKQLRAVKKKPCALVLSNPHNAFVHLDRMIILGAMLGRVGISIPYNPAIRCLDATQTSQTFLDGGKMVRYRNSKPFAPQNTTISAICVLGFFNPASRQLGIQIKRWEQQSGKKRTLEKVWEMAIEAENSATPKLVPHLRLVVYENPYAATPLCEAFGTGPYDERFGFRDGQLTRIFVGPELVAIEKEEEAVGIRQSTY
ncbi:MAG: hypothetical protein ACOYXU_14255 [Nitrospirota bacterium]